MKGTARVLTDRHFRRLAVGLGISFAGSTMQNAAVLWHVSMLSGADARALTLGAIGLSRTIPIALCAVPSGLLADTCDRRRIMLLSQIVGILVAATFALLTVTDHMSVFRVCLLVGLTTAASVVDLPARQALLVTMVASDQVADAISVTTVIFQCAAIAGPALAGLTIANYGLAPVYALNAASFVCVIYPLCTMAADARFAPRTAVRRGDQRLDLAALASRTREGFGFAMRSPIIRSSLLVDMCPAIFASSSVLLPLIAQERLHVGPAGYGWLLASPGVGALVSSSALALRRPTRPGRLLFVGALVCGIATIGVGASLRWTTALACLFAFGAAEGVMMVSRSIVRQTETPDRLKGRMAGVSMLFFLAGPQVGEFEAGLVANAFSPGISIVSGGVCCLLAAVVIVHRAPELLRYRPAGVSARSPELVHPRVLARLSQ